MNEEAAVKNKISVNVPRNLINCHLSTLTLREIYYNHDFHSRTENVYESYF
jgi:hypothetical protein